MVSMTSLMINYGIFIMSGLIINYEWFDYNNVYGKFIIHSPEQCDDYFINYSNLIINLIMTSLLTSGLDKKPSAVAKYFCLNGHSLDDVKIQILENILKPPMLKSTTKHRKMKELHWIYQLKTLEPIGLNTMENIHETLACI